MIIAIGIISFLTACSNDQWDKHYRNDETYVGQSLTEYIQSQSNLSLFYRMLEISGMDSY